MTATLPIASDWCFDIIDISALRRPAQAKPQPQPQEQAGFTAAIALELIFGELRYEADRPIRDRLNEALRQWHLGRHPAARNTDQPPPN